MLTANADARFVERVFLAMQGPPIITLVSIALLAWLTPQPAKGDGGLILLHEARGAFLATVFVSPEVVRGGRTDLSVLVQSSTNGEVLLDAEVGLVVESPPGLASSLSDPFCGTSQGQALSYSPFMDEPRATAPATRGQASNKLLYAADLDLNAPGPLRLHVYISRGTDAAWFECPLPATQISKTAGLWPCWLIPPIAIAAFAMNQKLRKHSLEQAEA